MAELPTGTVSMLFSDIEGSTLILTRLGAEYLQALDGHRRIMRASWSAHGGTEMGTEGDSFFVVFRSAGDAVAAATTAQRALEGHAWPGGESLRVRIGIHTGAPEVHDGGYWGLDVHRAARIAASAHGGQVVVSEVTAQLASGGLPPGVALRDLGFHTLKDLPAPEHLYQVSVDGLQQEFAPLRSLGASSSLPQPTTALLGREAELDELAGLLEAPGVRLLTLTGPGGSGKTRLATAAAARLVRRFPDGVYFVPLASVGTAEVMWTSLAEVLDVPPRERTPALLTAHLARRSLLLVLDNLEQLDGADEVIGRVLDGAPGVVVVATSRQALGLSAEMRHPVAPLSLPRDDTLDAAGSAAAVQLFVQRARSVEPRFRLTPENVHDVVAVCRRLDGLPLAIELCASRVRLLGPRALLARLDKALDIASTDRLVPPRHRTLRDTIRWSYELLPPEQQAFLRRLSVFAAGGDLEAIAAVAGDAEGRGTETDPLDLIAALLDASLASIAEDLDGEPRVTLLATIRAFAWDQLRAEGELDEVRVRHAEHYTVLAERLRALRETRHTAALGRVETELDNFREALEWSLPPDESSGAGDLALGLRLCAALGWVWVLGGYVTEGRRWNERVIARAGGSPSRQLAACLSALANVLTVQGESERALEVARQSLAMARSLDDSAATAYALSVLGTAQQQVGDVEGARATLREALEDHRRDDDRAGLARALGHLAGIEERLGRFDDAEALTRQSLEIFEQIGDAHGAVVQNQNLANLLAVAGRPGEAHEVARALVDAVLRLRSPTLTMAFANTYMNILLRNGEPALAAELFGAEEAMHDRLGIPNPFADEELAEARELLGGAMSAEEWDGIRARGRRMRVEDLLARLGPSRDEGGADGAGRGETVR